MTKYGYSPFRVLVDWWEVEIFGNDFQGVGPRGGNGRDGEAAVETRLTHWSMVEGAMMREGWRTDRVRVLKSLMSDRILDCGAWWRDGCRPPTVLEALNAIEDDVAEFYRWKSVDNSPRP